MSCLVRFIRFAKETATWLVSLGFVRAFFVRMPPRNYGEGSSVFATAETEPQSLDESRSDETLVNLSRSFDDSPAYAQGDPENTTDCFVCKKCRKSSEQFDMAILKAASDRVSDILREHRQKVDAGEDPCAMRREARRKRTQELVLLAGAF